MSSAENLPPNQPGSAGQPQPQFASQPSPYWRPRRTEPRRSWLDSAVRTILIGLAGALISGFFVGFWEFQKTTTNLEDRVKSAEDKLSDQRTTTATTQQLKALDDKVSDLRAALGTYATLQQVKALEDKLADLKADQVSAVAINNLLDQMKADIAKLQSQTLDLVQISKTTETMTTTLETEVTALRNQQKATDAVTWQHTTLANQYKEEITRLRSSGDAVCEDIAKLRERLARLEAASTRTEGSKSK